MKQQKLVFDAAILSFTLPLVDDDERWSITIISLLSFLFKDNYVILNEWLHVQRMYFQ